MARGVYASVNTDDNVAVVDLNKLEVTSRISSGDGSRRPGLGGNEMIDQTQVSSLKSEPPV